MKKQLTYPAGFPQKLLAWFAENKREMPWRGAQDAYAVWVSEIMLQQTRVETVREYYIRFMQAFPTMHALADAPEDQLMKLWQGLGYYSRARNLAACARQVVSEYGGKLPQEPSKLVKLPGIGAYTAGAVASIAYGRPEPAVDGNVLRITARITGTKMAADAPEFRKLAAESLKPLYPPGQCGDFTQALMELGATVCVPNGAPLCGKCPVQAECFARKNNCIEELPAPPKKLQKTIQKLDVFLLHCGNKTAIRKRAEKGLLAGLWELPNTPGNTPEKDIPALAEEMFGVQVKSCRCGRMKKHIFTHIEWQMTPWHIECTAPAVPDSPVWAEPDELANKYTLPKAFSKLL